MSKNKKITLIIGYCITLIAIVIYGIYFYFDSQLKAIEAGIELPYEPVVITTFMLCAPVILNIIFSIYGNKLAINITSVVALSVVFIGEMIYSGFFRSTALYVMFFYGLYSTLVSYPTLIVLLILNNINFEKKEVK